MWANFRGVPQPIVLLGLRLQWHQEMQRKYSTDFRRSSVEAALHSKRGTVWVSQTTPENRGKNIEYYSEKNYVYLKKNHKKYAYQLVPRTITSISSDCEEAIIHFCGRGKGVQDRNFPHDPPRPMAPRKVIQLSPHKRIGAKSALLK